MRYLTGLVEKILHVTLRSFEALIRSLVDQRLARGPSVHEGTVGPLAGDIVCDILDELVSPIVHT